MAALVAFSHLPLSERAVVAAAAVLFFLYGLLLLRTAFRGGWLAIARHQIRTWWTTSRRASASDMDEALHRKMQETRLANMKALIELLTHIYLVTCSGITVRLLSIGRIQAWRVLAIALAGASVTPLLRACPQLLRPGTLRPWQCFYFAVGCVLVLPGICPPSRLLGASRIGGLILTAFNCGLLHLPTAAAQHGLYVALVGLSLRSSPPHSDELAHHLSIEVVAAAFSCTCVATMQRLVEAQHRSALQAGCLAEKQLASGKLLGIFYDVVVDVDEELAIVSSEPDLGLFLSHGVGRPVPILLSELLPEAQDRQQLLQHTTTSGSGLRTPGESSVDVLHLSMGHGGSGSSSRLSVELFSHRFRGLLGRHRHLLGIREFGNGDELRRDGSCLTMRLDVSDDRCTIVDISLSLQRELGCATPGNSLLHFIENGERFKDQLQRGFNTLLADDGLEPTYSFKTVLRPRGQRTRMLADCRLSIDADEATEEDKDMARLSFGNLTPL